MKTQKIVLEGLTVEHYRGWQTEVRLNNKEGYPVAEIMRELQSDSQLSNGAKVTLTIEVEE